MQLPIPVSPVQYRFVLKYRFIKFGLGPIFIELAVVNHHSRDTQALGLVGQRGGFPHARIAQQHQDG